MCLPINNSHYFLGAAEYILLPPLSQLQIPQMQDDKVGGEHREKGGAMNKD